MTTEITPSSPLYGKPWKIDSSHGSFESADERRKVLETATEGGIQVKVKYRPEKSGAAQKFDVKIRSTNVKPPKKGKKKNKSRQEPKQP